MVNFIEIFLKVVSRFRADFVCILTELWEIFLNILSKFKKFKIILGKLWQNFKYLIFNLIYEIWQKFQKNTENFS